MTPQNQRPALTTSISVADFRAYYWLKQELVDFCRQHGISSNGGKIEIAQRIEQFLATGAIEQPIKSGRKHQPQPMNEALTLDTVIHEGFVCTQRHRTFFTSIEPHFHFSTFIQNYIKANVGKTYRDIIATWHEHEHAKKRGDLQTSIAPQFEYNQFTRDFFNDPKNKGKTRRDAIRAWKVKRSLPGDNRYSPDDHYE